MEKAPRVRRWTAWYRLPVAVTAACALALGIYALAHLLRDGHERRLAHRARAVAVVKLVGMADIGEVAAIARRLRPLNSLVRDRLRYMARPGPPELATRRRNAALALLGDDPAQAEYLVDRIVRDDVEPQELLVVRQALIDQHHAARLAPRLWSILAKPDDRGGRDVNLGAAGALAQFCPDDPRWADLAAPIAAALVSQSDAALGGWWEVFRPLRQSLTSPLRDILADVDRPREHALAYRLLFDDAVRPSNPDHDRDLVAMIPDATPDELLAIRRVVKDRAQAVQTLLANFEQPFAATGENARRRGRIANALIVFGSPDRAWRVLVRSAHDDPSTRTELLHALAPSGVAAGEVVDRLLVETDADARRALILSLGGYAPTALAEPVRRAATEFLLERYSTDNDPGTHSAIDWLLRTKWGLSWALDAVNDAIRGNGPMGRRDWFVNSEGVTMIVVRAARPLEFTMGSAEDEPGRGSDERIHTARLDRSFAIATREVSAAQFERFLACDDSRFIGPSAATGTATGPLCPAMGVDWRAAAAYCNWLSRYENLPPYYTIGRDRVSVADRDGLGYRLPSEEEWEYACRAGSSTARPQGSSAAFLDEYAWSMSNSGMHPQPVATRKPNDLGLFDMLGNAVEWTEAGTTEVASGKVEAVLRGGSFGSPATSLRAAYRECRSPSVPLEAYGFRYVRTMEVASKMGVRW
jgi:formylglycine-generating enzyme required for sulfatase activity